MILADDIAAKVKRIQLMTRKVINDFVSGQFRSKFKGTGMQFSEHRIYQHGDDVRHIDWKVSARSHDLHFKKFEEERELTVLLLVDSSQSLAFSSQSKLKSEVIAEIAGMLSYAAVLNGDKVGALFFSDKLEKSVPPKKGKSHVLRLIHDLLSFKGKNNKTNLGAAFQHARQALKHSSVVIVLSDFIDSKYEKDLKFLSKKHDVILIQIADPNEKTLEFPGWLRLLDPESGEEYTVKPSQYTFSKFLTSVDELRGQEIRETVASSRVEWLPISTKDDAAEAVVKFLEKRSRRKKSEF